MEIIRDVAYTPEFGEDGIGDLFLPDQSANQGKPLKMVLAIHGGGWIILRKDSFEGVAMALAEQGFAVFNINYRRAGDAPFPACVDDAMRAAEFLLESDDLPRKERMDRSRISTTGASAGGHLALMTGLRLPPEKVDAIAALSAVSALEPDFQANGERYRKLFGKEPDGEQMRSANPTTFLHKGSPRILLTHFVRDPVVPCASAESFLKTAKERGVNCSAYFFDWMRDNQGHALWIPESAPHRLYPDLEQLLITFMKQA